MVNNYASHLFFKLLKITTKKHNHINGRKNLFFNSPKTINNAYSNMWCNGLWKEFYRQRISPKSEFKIQILMKINKVFKFLN